MQRYKCVSCDHQFQSLRRPNRFINRLWEDYVWKKQSLKQLGDSLGRSMKWVRTKLDEVDQRENPINPSSVVIIADTTFWGRSYGVCVFRSPSLKRNIWWHEVESEKVAHYYYGRKILEERGWKFIGAVVDGRRGLTRVFGDIPVQICQFHQIKRVTNYLTRKPETLAGVELRELTLTLSRTIEKVFSKTLKSFGCSKKALGIPPTGTRSSSFNEVSIASSIISFINCDFNTFSKNQEFRLNRLFGRLIFFSRQYFRNQFESSVASRTSMKVGF